jgi:hypothetical protein
MSVVINKPVDSSFEKNDQSLREKDTSSCYILLHRGLLGLVDGNLVGQGGLGAGLARGVVRKHNLHLETKDTLAEEKVADSIVDIVADGVTGGLHVTIGELHGLGTLGTQLTRDGNLTTLSTRLHHETKHTVASTADSKTTEQLVSQGLALGNSAETTVEHLLSVELNATLREVESLLDSGSQLTNAATLLTEDILGAGGTDDDLCADGGHTDLDTSITILGQLTHEHLIELGVEHTVGNKLPLLGDSSCHFLNSEWMH